MEDNELIWWVSYKSPIKYELPSDIMRFIWDHFQDNYFHSLN